MIKALVILADGFEETEAIAPIDIFKRAGYDVTIAGLDKKAITGAHQITIQCDRILEEENTLYDLLFLPGGMPGTLNLLDSQKVLTLVQDHYKAGKLCTAICAAPRVLDAAGVLNGETFTCYPGADETIKAGVSTNKDVETSNNIITGKGMGVSIAFALNIVKKLTSIDTSSELAQRIIFEADF